MIQGHYNLYQILEHLECKLVQMGDQASPIVEVKIESPDEDEKSSSHDQVLAEHVVEVNK